jgi:putative pyruvate formate lyase activating enzyme
MLSYEHCTLCPRRCGVDRTKGERGFCGMPDKLYAARAGAHYWEEPVISGSFGSGAIFFSGCTLRCAFCQNYTISDEHFGRELTPQALRAAMERLIDEGVQNINLVTPTHFLPSILPALKPKLPVPVVYNCGGYESVETLRQLEGKIDVYLPDFKYSDNALAKRLSAAPDYYETAAAAILEMYRQVGRP